MGSLSKLIEQLHNKEAAQPACNSELFYEIPKFPNGIPMPLALILPLEAKAAVKEPEQLVAQVNTIPSTLPPVNEYGNPVIIIQRASRPCNYLLNEVVKSYQALINRITR